jgi:hypothetical protein
MNVEDKAMRPALILVGADKGGVGKTTVSRVLLDYLADRAIPTRAFDTEAPRGTLARFYPDLTEVVNIARTADQMRIFDTLDAEEAKVSLVDVRAGHLRTILGSLEEFGFLDAARRGQFDFLLFHILGSSIASLEEIAEIAPFVADGRYYLVKNYVSDGTYFEWDPDTYRSYFSRAKGATELTIPRLNELAYEQIDLTGVPFSRFVADEANSFVLRGYVRTWRQNLTTQLDDAAVGGVFGRRAPAKRELARAAAATEPSGTAAETGPSNGPEMSRLEEISEMLLERLRALDEVGKSR